MKPNLWHYQCDICRGVVPMHYSNGSRKEQHADIRHAIDHHREACTSRLRFGA